MNQVHTGYPYELGAEDPFAPGAAFVPACPMCSGEVRRDGPAAQAFDWALLQTEDQAWDPHGRLAAVSDALMAPEVAGEEADVLREFAGAVTLPAWERALITQRQRVLDEFGDRVEVLWDGKDQESEETPKEGDGTEEGGEEGDARPWWEDDRDLPECVPPADDKTISTPDETCCVIVFEYPLGEVERIEKWTKRMHQRGSTRYGPWVGWKFRVLAIFKNTGTDPKTGKKCRCKCCRFVQRVEGEHTSQDFFPSGDPGSPPGRARGDEHTEKSSGEDTVEITERGGARRVVRYGVGDSYFAYSEDKKERSYEYSTTEPGSSDAPSEEEKSIPGLTAAINKALREHNLRQPGGGEETRKTICVYYMQDAPGIEAAWYRRVRYDKCFTGQIWNKCPEWQRKREDKFRLYLSGYCVESGSEGRSTGKFKMRWDPNPPGDQRVIKDCAPP